MMGWPIAGMAWMMLVGVLVIVLLVVLIVVGVRYLSGGTRPR